MSGYRASDYWASDYWGNDYWDTGASAVSDWRRSGPQFDDGPYWKAVAKRRKAADEERKARDAKLSAEMATAAQQAVDDEFFEPLKHLAPTPEQDEEDIEFLVKKAVEQEHGLIAEFLKRWGPKRGRS